MEKLIDDYSFGATLLFWQVFILLGLIVSIWALIVLAKDQRESLGVKLLVFVSFFFYYYNNESNKR